MWGESESDWVIERASQAVRKEGATK
jgi:hypothetical protein